VHQVGNSQFMMHRQKNIKLKLIFVCKFAKAFTKLIVL